MSALDPITLSVIQAGLSQVCAEMDLSFSRAAFSPIMMQGAFVFPLTICGMIDASATRRPSMPLTLSLGSTTALSSIPILQVPVG